LMVTERMRLKYLVNGANLGNDQRRVEYCHLVFS
jgi:hypothetical protein